MASPILVEASWASGGKYDSYRLSATGHFYGFVHRSGFAFMANPDPQAKIDEELKFMACRNIGTGFGAICASIPKSFGGLPLNEKFPCDLILHGGVHYYPEKK